MCVIRIIPVTLSCPRILQRFSLQQGLVYFLHFSEQDRVSFKYRPPFLNENPERERRWCSPQTLAWDPAWQRPVLRAASDPCSSSASAASSSASRPPCLFSVCESQCFWAEMVRVVSVLGLVMFSVALLILSLISYVSIKKDFIFTSPKYANAGGPRMYMFHTGFRWVSDLSLTCFKLIS